MTELRQYIAVISLCKKKKKPHSLMKTNRFSEGATKQYLIFYSMQGVLKINGRYLKQIDSEN